MATARMPIMGKSTLPDDAGPSFAPISTQITNNNAPALELCLVLDCDPADDLGCSGNFSIPEDYSADPVLIIRGIIDGTVGSQDIYTGMQLRGRADNETYDIALEAEDIDDFQSDAYTDEDVFEETIALTVTLATRDDVSYHFFIDASGATPFTGNILVTGLFLQYTTT